MVNNSSMKKTILIIAFVFATTALFAAEVAKPVRIAFGGAGWTTLGYPEDRVRIQLSMFLNDVLGHEPYFQIVSEDRTAGIWRRIKCGALDYGTDDKYVIYNRYYPVDIVCDYNPHNMIGEWRCEAFTLEVWNSKGVIKDIVPDKGSLFPHALRILDMIIEASGVPDDAAKRMREYAKEKSKIFYAIYMVPRFTGHYCDNTGETRMKLLKPVMSAAKGDPRVAARIVDAGYWTFADSRQCRDTPASKLIAMGADAVHVTLGSEFEDLIRPFVSSRQMKARMETELLPIAGILGDDAETRMLNDALAMDTSDEFGEEMDKFNETKSEAQKDAAARGALKALAWQMSRKALPIITACASHKNDVTRRCAAYTLGCYTNAADSAKLLHGLVTDNDPLVAAIAAYGMLKNKFPCPNAAAAARRALDAGKMDTGVIGVRGDVMALSVLADTGDNSDRSRFAAHTGDAEIAARREAVRGIFGKTDVTEADLVLLDDPDHTVTVAGIHEIKAEQLKNKAFYEKMVAFANDPCDAVSDAARTVLDMCRPAGGNELTEFRLTLENPYTRRRIIDAAASKRDAESVAMLVNACSNLDPHTRAYALKKLLGVDAAKAHDEAMRLVTEPHTFVRFYAALVLAETAVAGDAEILNTAYGKEKDRAAKLYLADAVAKAEGKPKPPAQPDVNSIYKTGWANNWMCAMNGPYADTELHDGYYTCGLPTKPTPEMKIAHDEHGAAIFPRPTPCGNPGMILIDPTTADTYWTTLDKQMPAGVVEYVDGLVYGEESMSLDPSEGIWKKSWRIFCEDAGIDPDRVRGDQSKLTANEKLAWKDWGTRLCIEGFNELYDFTKDYWGKIRPGIQICTYITSSYGNTPYDKLFKFDVAGSYIYDGDLRRMYAHCRSIKTTWPDRPLQWLSFGNINIGLGSSSHAKPVTYKTTMPTHAISRRFEHCYADSFAVWLAGADTGYFTHYGLAGPDGKNGGGACTQQNIYPDNAAFAEVVDSVFKDVEPLYRDEAKATARNKKAPTSMLDDDESIDSIMLEEEGGADDPVMKRLKERREYVYNGFLYKNRMTRDTVSCELGLPRLYPGNFSAFMFGGASYSPAGMLLSEFDVIGNFSQPVRHARFDKYVFGIISGGAEIRMTEETRQGWIKWLTDNPVVLVVNGRLSPGVKFPYCSAECIDGDLKTPWPWDEDIGWSPAVKATGKTPEKPARYVVNGGNAKVLVEDAHGPTRVMWCGKDMKGVVIFDVTSGRDAIISMRETLAEVFKEKNIGVELSEHPGRLAGKAPGLTCEILSWSSFTTNNCSGFDLLTGAYNPLVTPKFNCAVVTDEYVSPCMAIHGGVNVMGEDCRLEVIEKLNDGVKVKVKGLVRVATKSGKPASITGKALPEIKTDPNKWYILGKEEGICTLPPHGDVECIKWNAEDEMPVWRIFRVKDWTELTIRDVL